MASNSNMNSNENSRLDRIEDKLDRLADVIVSMARVEEKLAKQEENTTIFLQTQKRLDERVDEVEKQSEKNHAFIDTVKTLLWGIFWAVISIGGGVITYILQK